MARTLPLTLNYTVSEALHSEKHCARPVSIAERDLTRQALRGTTSSDPEGAPLPDRVHLLRPTAPSLCVGEGAQSSTTRPTQEMQAEFPELREH